MSQLHFAIESDA